MTVRVAGIGTALPDKIVTNHDLAEQMDTSDAWIRERSGIGERRVGGLTSTMAIDAAVAAIEDAHLSPADIDFIALARAHLTTRFRAQAPRWPAPSGRNAAPWTSMSRALDSPMRTPPSTA